MIKALFLDMDKTLCDTEGADQKSLKFWIKILEKETENKKIARMISEQFLNGIYRKAPANELYQLPKNLSKESDFRTKLFQNIFHYFYPDKKITKKKTAAIIKKLNKIRIKNYKFFTQVKKILKELKIVIITNGPSYSQVPKIKVTKMDRFADLIIIGGEEANQKPHPGIFEKALSYVGFKKDEVIHIGDSVQADILGAQNFGIKSIWINPEELNLAENLRTDFQVMSFVKIPEILTLLQSQE